MSEEQIVSTESGTNDAAARDYEAEAREQGWAPKEEYKGDPAKWKDAKKFVEDGEHIAGLATKRKRDLERELDELRVTLSQQQQVYSRQLQKERAEREAAIQQLETERAKAITNGDGNQAVKLERQIRNLETENQYSIPQPSPVAMAWHSQNPWYGADERLTRAADGIGQTYRAYNPGASESEILEHVSAEVGKIMQMQGQRRPQSPDSSTPQRKAGKKDTGFSELPDEIKTIARRLIKSGAPQMDASGKVRRDDKGRPVPMTEEYYAKQYFSK